MFVDDEENILSALRRELRQWCMDKGLEMVTFTSPSAALEALAECSDYAIVVSDLRMPEMKGSDFLLRVRESWPSIVTILLTGFSELEEVMKVVKAGIFSYILKPWDSEYLLSELGKALETYTVKMENERYRRQVEEELRWAGEMQRTILKPVPIKPEGVEFRSSWRPVPGLFCGGDYYDVITIGPGRNLVLVGDVSGHGIRGALVTGILKAVIYPEYVRGSAGKQFSPGAFLSWLNDRMNFELRKTAGLLVAFFAGIIDRREMRLTYANAGLPHPYLVRGGTSSELPVSGSAIGFAGSVLYSENTVDLAQGDTLIIYTDGLSEIGLGPSGVQQPPLARIFAQQAYGADYHKRIMDAALEGVGREAFTDDLTLVTARIE